MLNLRQWDEGLASLESREQWNLKIYEIVPLGGRMDERSQNLGGEARGRKVGISRRKCDGHDSVPQRGHAAPST